MTRADLVPAARDEDTKLIEKLRAELERVTRSRAAIADRLVTIADEAFGLGPVETVDETLTRIEHGLSAWHIRRAELEAEVESLRCGDLVAFHDGELDPARADKFRVHLERCEACQAMLVDVKQMDARLSELGEARQPGKR